MSGYDLVVGINSYVDLSEADEYVSAHFVSDADERIKWEAMSDLDKAVFLRAGVQAIESVRWTGKKLSDAQPLCFPRIKFSPFQTPYFTKNYAQSNERDVKEAQIEEAIARACPTDGQMRKARLNDGVRHSAIGSVQESFGEVKSAGGAYLASVFESLQAQELLQKYLGSYEVN